jgi:hypothetical protein
MQCGRNSVETEKDNIKRNRFFLKPGFCFDCDLTQKIFHLIGARARIKKVFTFRDLLLQYKPRDHEGDPLYLEYLITLKPDLVNSITEDEMNDSGNSDRCYSAIFLENGAMSHNTF